MAWPLAVVAVVASAAAAAAVAAGLIVVVVGPEDLVFGVLDSVGVVLCHLSSAGGRLRERRRAARDYRSWVDQRRENIPSCCQNTRPV